jgi:hypothetical protein
MAWQIPFNPLRAKPSPEQAIHHWYREKECAVRPQNAMSFQKVNSRVTDVFKHMPHGNNVECLIGKRGLGQLAANY